MVYEIDKYKKKFIYIHVKNISKNEWNTTGSI
jgi:hypothetical protein